MQLRMIRSLAIVLPMVQTATLASGESGGQPPARQATERVTATATFGPRSSLRVSSQVLQFQITDASTAAEASVEFAAGVRTTIGGDVLLVAQVADPIALPASATIGALTIVGGTDGAIAGTAARGEPVVAARWTGGGLRTGRVTFRLQAAPGRYDIPVTFLVKLADGS